MTDNSNFGGPSAAQAAAGNAAAKVTPYVDPSQNPALVNTPGTPQYSPSGFAKQVAKPVEPTVISSSNITNQVIPGLNQKAADVSQKGTYIDQTGAMRYSDGSAVPAPTSAEFDPTTNSWKDQSGNYSAGPQYVDNPTGDPDIAQTNQLFDSLKANLDANTLQQVNSIQQQYDSLRAAQTTANNAANGARTTLNLRSGTARFAPLDAAGTALAQTTYGLQQIAKLDADENSAIAQVKAAQSSGNYQLMSKALDIVDASRTAKQAAAQKITDQLSVANEAVQKQQQQNLEDNAIAKLVGSGVTNPADVLKQMTAAGYAVSAADVSTALKNLAPTSTAGDTYKFDTTKTGSLLGAGLTMKQIQDVQDYYNGKGSGEALSELNPAQKAAVQTALVGKVTPEKTPSDPNAISLGAADKQTLAGADFNEQDIVNIQADVNAHGIQKVLNGTTDPKQQQAIRQVYGGSAPKAEVPSKLTRSSVSSLFGIPDDGSDTDTNGWMPGGHETTSHKLDGIMESIKKYQDVGYSDAEILKLMQ